MKIILKPLGAFVFFLVPITVVVINLVVASRQRSVQTPISSDAAKPSGQPSVLNVVRPVRLDPRSPVQNPSFEEVEGEKKPANWIVDLAGNNAVNVSYVEGIRGAHSGNLELTNYGGNAYDVRTTQKLIGLKNGKYTLQAWARNNASGRNESFLVAKDFGDGESRKDKQIPRSDDWIQVKVTDISVTRGECTIGLYSQAEGGSWTQIDDVEFIPQD